MVSRIRRLKIPRLRLADRAPSSAGMALNGLTREIDWISDHQTVDISTRQGALGLV